MQQKSDKEGSDKAKRGAHNVAKQIFCMTLFIPHALSRCLTGRMNILLRPLTYELAIIHESEHILGSSALGFAISLRAGS